jgi:hypothetical protein
MKMRLTVLPQVLHDAQQLYAFVRKVNFAAARISHKLF